MGTGARVEQEDADVQWLDSSFTTPKSPTVAARDVAVLNEELTTQPPEGGSDWTGRTIHVSVHDPPWASGTGLRAPPPSPSDLI